VSAINRVYRCVCETVKHAPVKGGKIVWDSAHDERDGRRWKRGCGWKRGWRSTTWTTRPLQRRNAQQPTIQCILITVTKSRAPLHVSFLSIPIVSSSKRHCKVLTTTTIRLIYSSAIRQPFNSPLSPSIIHSLFHSRLKTHLFHKSFPP